MHNLHRRSVGPPARDEPDRSILMDDISTCPRPGEVFAEIGRVIAVCLGLGVLAHVLVAIVGN